MKRRVASTPSSNSSRPTPKVTTQPPLSRAALRLLAAMGEAGIAAIPDPTRAGTIILQASCVGPSLGRGSHPEAALTELDRRDLVQRDARGLATISEPGRAHLRRGPAGDASGFSAQHRDLARTEIPGDTGPERVVVNTGESPLEWLRRRRDRDGEPMIDAAAFTAGERLRQDLTFAGMLPSVTARWDGAVASETGGARDPAGTTDAVIAARQRARAALAATGPDFADLLLDLCGFLKGLETIERDRNWPARSAKVVVRLALRQLARHYGLESEARGPAGAPDTRTWIAPEAVEAA